MLNLNVVLSASVVKEVQEYTALRIKGGYALKTAEALALSEQRYLSRDKIKELSEEAYGTVLYEPRSNYVPEDIVMAFRTSGAVPVAYLPMVNTVHAVYLPEFEPTERPQFGGRAVELYPTTLNYYLEHYQVLYGRHEMLQDIPGSLLFKSIVHEAINLGAADITISTVGRSSRVYYNIRKKLVESNRIMSAESMDEIITYLTIKSPYNWGTREPKYADVDLTKEYRGRVIINAKHKGYSITIRLLPNKAFDMDVEGIGLTKETCMWLQEQFLDRTPGLRLIVGETMSGKNTTALALLRRLVLTGGYKVVSVEMPVEQELPGVEQINTETVAEYGANIKSLIHQNPDFVYITEIRDSTGLDTIQITNTGKRVMSTLHANGVADVLPRLVDITGLSLDRIVQSLHSVVFQKLIRDDERDIVYPRDRYVRFTDGLKYRLYGKTLGEMLKIIREEEDGDEF